MILITQSFKLNTLFCENTLTSLSNLKSRSSLNTTKTPVKAANHQQGVRVVGVRHRHVRRGEGGELRGDTEHMQGVRAERGGVRQQRDGVQQAAQGPQRRRRAHQVSQVHG